MFLPARLAFASVFFSRTLAIPQQPTVFASFPSRFPLPGSCVYPGSGGHGVHGDTRVTASIFSGSTYKSNSLASLFSLATALYAGFGVGVGVGVDGLRRRRRRHGGESEKR